MIKIDEHREVKAEVLYIAVLSPYIPIVLHGGYCGVGAGEDSLRKFCSL